MRAFHRKTIASCLFLIILFLTIGSAAGNASNETLEVRGPVYDGSDLDDIISTYGDGTTLKINATQFAVFYYETD